MKTEEELLLKILNGAEEYRTISEVAQSLFLSQPYVSQVIIKAEKKYDLKLINRSRNPIGLTPGGEQLRKGLTKLISQRNEIRLSLRPYQKSADNLVTIAYTPLWLDKQGTIIKKLQAKFLYTRFELQQVFTSDTSYNLLKTHAVDIFWGRFLKSRELKTNYLDRQTAYLIIPRSSAIYDHHHLEVPFSLKKLNQLNHSNMVSLQHNSWYQRAVDHFFEDNSIYLNKVIFVNDFIAATDLAINGLGVTVALASAIKFIHNRQNFNLMKIPPAMLNLDTGISIYRNSSELVNSIATELTRLIKKIKY